MPIFTFKPLDPTDPVWEASSHRGRCRVHARDEVVARAYLNEFFSGGYIQHPFVDEHLGILWGDTKLAPCVSISESGPDGYQEGRIEIIVHDASSEPTDGLLQWKVVCDGERTVSENEVEGSGVPKWGASNWDGAEDRDTSDIQRPLRAGDPIGRQQSREAVVPTAVIQNRTLLMLHTTGLLHFLDDYFDESPFRNSPRPELWLADDPSDADLRRLLRQVHDELRNLNELLKTQAPVSNVYECLGGVRKYGGIFLSKAAAAAGTGTGLLVAMLLGQLLVDGGMIKSSHLCGLIDKMKG